MPIIASVNRTCQTKEQLIEQTRDQCKALMRETRVESFMMAAFHRTTVTERLISLREPR